MCTAMKTCVGGREHTPHACGGAEAVCEVRERDGRKGVRGANYSLVLLLPYNFQTTFSRKRMYPNPSALPLAAVAELELLLGKEAPLDAAAASSFPDALLEDSKRNRPRPLLLVSGTPPAARNQRNQRGASPPTPMTPLFGEDDDDAFTPSSSSPQRKQASASSWVQRAKHGSHRRRQREAAPAASRLGSAWAAAGAARAATRRPAAAGAAMVY